MELKNIIEHFMMNYGLISIFIIVALEYANVTLPSEVVLPIAGMFAYKYNFGFVNVIVVSTLGGVIGSLLNYFLGFKFGKPLIDTIGEKYPKTKSIINSSYIWLKKHDKLSVILTRVIPYARTFVSIIAGSIKMNIFTFMMCSAIGIGIWNTSLISIGYVLGDNLKFVMSLVTKYSYIMVILLLIITIVYGFIKYRLKNKKICK
ncbi:DedA family protein [Romboutsia sp. 1001285H_161024_C4]|uniref:DedA family protein n=1 Tax=Romboutsia sp. 1001285H_161024_C4 TaxID=2787109 RepID=UPI00189C3ADE|nr:DedA family protein [Romboutsia sp. 1001285H_161024_C4]